MAVTIIWSAVHDRSYEACVVRRTTQILSLSKPDPQDAAATALKWWFEEDAPTDGYANNWDCEIGADETEASAHVVIHEPADMAGVFEVHLERTIVARGYQTDTADAEKYTAIANRAQHPEAA